MEKLPVILPRDLRREERIEACAGRQTKPSFGGRVMQGIRPLRKGEKPIPGSDFGVHRLTKKLWGDVPRHCIHSMVLV